MKKGFTLIELLAVIVILAIIALIATPIILGIINDAKEDSNKRSIENYAHAVELSVARYAAGNDGVVPVGKYEAKGKILTNKALSATPSQLEIDYKGEEITGEVEITSDGQVIITGANIGNGKTKYDYSEKDGVTETKEESNEAESSEINMISLKLYPDEDDYEYLMYYKGSGDVVLENANIIELYERAFMKNNVFVINYEISDGTCGSGSCPKKVVLFILDKAIEEDLRNYYANNSLGYEVEVIVPKSSKEIEEKYYEIYNAENNGIQDVYADYYAFENGELNEDAIGYETNITSIDLSNLVGGLSIADLTFSYMTNLKTIKLPINMDRIDAEWFNGNTSLEKIINPYKAGEIEEKNSRWNYDEVLGKYHTVEYGTLLNEKSDK